MARNGLEFGAAPPGCQRRRPLVSAIAGLLWTLLAAVVTLGVVGAPLYRGFKLPSWLSDDGRSAGRRFATGPPATGADWTGTDGVERLREHSRPPGERPANADTVAAPSTSHSPDADAEAAPVVRRPAVAEAVVERARALAKTRRWWSRPTRRR